MRAATFLVGDSFSFQESFITSFAADVKGVGTHVDASDMISDPKKNGWLSSIDALKEFAFQKLIAKIARSENQKWGTVEFYAIIDTGLRFKPNVKNPATDFYGDRIVLVVRQSHSRLSPCRDEPCFFSVAQDLHLQSEFGKQMRTVFHQFGVSTEFVPTSLLKYESTEESLEDVTYFR